MGELVIEEGKCYRMANGLKAGPMDVSYPGWVAYIDRANTGIREPSCWYNKLGQRLDKADDPTNLVAEWHDTPTELAVGQMWERVADNPSKSQTVVKVGDICIVSCVNRGGQARFHETGMKVSSNPLGEHSNYWQYVGMADTTPAPQVPDTIQEGWTYQREDWRWTGPMKRHTPESQTKKMSWVYEVEGFCAYCRSDGTANPDTSEIILSTGIPPGVAGPTYDGQVYEAPDTIPLHEPDSLAAIAESLRGTDYQGWGIPQQQDTGYTKMEGLWSYTKPHGDFAPPSMLTEGDRRGND